jgi:hypothetical protein
MITDADIDFSSLMRSSNRPPVQRKPRLEAHCHDKLRFGVAPRPVGSGAQRLRFGFHVPAT